MAHVRSLFFDGPLAEVENKSITAYKLGRPSEVIWNITNRCNLLCEHCYMAADGHAKPDQLSDEETLDIVRQMGEAGVPLLFLTGGEPFMRPNFWEILGAAREQDIRVTISTNCTFIDRDVAKRLKGYGVGYIGTSLYGPADFHDAMVRVPGTRERVIESIKILREEGVGVALKTAVSTDTWPHIYDIIQEAKDLDCGLIYLCDLITSGRSEGEEDGRISAEQWRELAEFIADDLTNGESTLEYDIGAMPSFIPYIAELLTARGYDLTRGLERLKVVSSCPVGKGHMNINSEGGIMPCQFAQDWTIGNIRDMSLDEATRELFKLADGETSGICSTENCEYSQICRGCRVKAFHQYDDPFAQDTTCILKASTVRRPLADHVQSTPNAAMPCGGPTCG
jgi:radical SAM protein with 4Fe4S-binding SPASM domain